DPPVRLEAEAGEKAGQVDAPAHHRDVAVVQGDRERSDVAPPRVPDGIVRLDRGDDLRGAVEAAQDVDLARERDRRVLLTRAETERRERMPARSRREEEARRQGHVGDEAPAVRWTRREPAAVGAPARERDRAAGDAGLLAPDEARWPTAREEHVAGDRP